MQIRTGRQVCTSIQCCSRQQTKNPEYSGFLSVISQPQSPEKHTPIPPTEIKKRKRKKRNNSASRDTVLGGSLRVGETVVAVAHEVFEGGSSIWQVMWVGNVLQERLLGMAENNINA